MLSPIRFLFCTAAIILSATCALAEPLALLVAKAEGGADARSAQLVLTLSLTADPAKAFAEFTAENVGKDVELRIDGEVVMKPRLVEPVVGGLVQVSGDFAGPELKAIADRINKGDAKVEVEAVAE